MATRCKQADLADPRHVALATTDRQHPRLRFARRRGHTHHPQPRTVAGANPKGGAQAPVSDCGHLRHWNLRPVARCTEGQERPRHPRLGRLPHSVGWRRHRIVSCPASWLPHLEVNPLCGAQRIGARGVRPGNRLLHCDGGSRRSSDPHRQSNKWREPRTYTAMTVITSGIDVIEIERIEAAVDRWGERFLQRIYTDAEQAYCRGKSRRLAGRFAAKEAASKALGVGVRHIRWRDIEILPDPRGKPTLSLH